MRKVFRITLIVSILEGLIFFGLKLTVTGKVIDNTNSGIQEINMKVNYSGYSPNSFVLKKGVPVKWNIEMVQLTGCNQKIVLKDYNIDAILVKGKNIIEFIPTKTGTLSFTYRMSMLRESFIVTEEGIATSEQIATSVPKSSSSCCCRGLRQIKRSGD